MGGGAEKLPQRGLAVDGNSQGDNGQRMAQAARLREEEAGGSGLPVPGFLQRLVEYPGRLRQFLHEVRVEMKQVNWPSWDDVKSTTTVVVITVAFFAIYFLLTDTVFSRMESWFWQRFRH